MFVYRIQHKKSKLGPFQHKETWERHPSQSIINYGVHGNTNAFEDIDNIPEVKKLLRIFKGRIRFGFLEKAMAEKAVIDREILAKYNFCVVRLSVEPLYISKGGTVLFLPNF